MQDLYADIILPLAIEGRYTYSIPPAFHNVAAAGVRVLVQVGERRVYTGIIARVHDEKPELEIIRPLREIADPFPLVVEKQLMLWEWMAEYYMCTEGEVMKAAIPAIFFLKGDISGPVSEKYKVRKETFVRLAVSYSEEELKEIFGKLGSAPRQADVLKTYLHLSDFEKDMEVRPVERSLLLKKSGSAPAALDSLVKKGILQAKSVETTRLKNEDVLTEPLATLSSSQQSVMESVQDQFGHRDVVLLHGITSSGKTEIYIHLIEEQLKKGKQVLYLLPEIALTAQIIRRLRKHFGNITGVYHSRFSDQERAEIWKKVAENNKEKGYRLILGVRSSVFLPFTDLGLVIVDEEHDASYKQHEPAPRYHARDSAIMLAGFHAAKTILGSATPSVESYGNAMSRKYGFAGLMERYGDVRLPEIILADTREAYRKRRMVSHFTPELLNAMDQALARKEQIILFRNRRGFAPYVECPECGWIQLCRQCAVSMTYHKSERRMLCHYCGDRTAVPSVCGNCGSPGLAARGFGTEKIEDEIRIVFPSARVARMDQDTTRGKNSFSRIIRDFEEKRIDILIGTQMISKGLDFENLTVVGILNADSMLNFPDFRAHERSFQLMEQVSGRAGRRQKQGMVVIQTADPGNRIIRLVLRHDYSGMYRMQAEERKTFSYPPFCRMVRIVLKHRDKIQLNSFSAFLADDLRSFLDERVLGPEFPVIPQIQLYHVKTILIKIEKKRSLSGSKKIILESIGRLRKMKGAGSLRIAVDVDP